MEAVQTIAEALDEVRQIEECGDGQRLYEPLARLRETVIEYGKRISHGQYPTSEELDQFASVLYPRFQTAYEAAGCPCGKDQAGMWRWLRQQAALIAEAERREREEAWQRGIEVLLHEIEWRRSVDTPVLQAL